jgi:hypothetical protein
MRSLVVAGVLVLVGCASSIEDVDDDPASVPVASYDVAAMPADLPESSAVVRDGVGVMVPAFGETAGAVVHRADGTTTTLEIAREPGGQVTVNEVGGTMIVEAATKECSDGAYALEGFHWASTYSWWFRSSTTPSANSVANTEDALRRGASNITGGHNHCKITDSISASHAYQGRTTKPTNIASTTTTVNCGKRDGVNVVAFGTLPISYLGITCYWYDGSKHALEADMKLSTRYAWFATSVPGGCSNRFGVEATATHEFGHVFGLAHVSESSHGELTMSPSMTACSLSPASLGLGDVRGLQKLY